MNVLQDSKDFSSFQMAKLVKHNRLNTRLEQLRKELNQKQTKKITKQHGGKFKHMDDVYSQKLASEDSSHYILAKRNYQKKKEELEGGSEKLVSVFAERKDIAKNYVDMIVESDEEIQDQLADSDGSDGLTCYTDCLVKPSTSKVKEDESGNGDSYSYSDTGKSINVDSETNESQNTMGEYVAATNNGKIRFRPVLEIESGSGSESESGSEADVKIVGESFFPGNNNVTELAEDCDEALQMAIEESLRDHKETVDEIVNETSEKEIKDRDAKVTDKVKDVSPKKTYRKFIGEKTKAVLSARQIDTASNKSSVEKKLENAKGSKVPLVTAGRKTGETKKTSTSVSNEDDKNESSKSKVNIVKAGINGKNNSSVIEVDTDNDPDDTFGADLGDTHDANVDLGESRTNMPGRSRLYKRKVSCVSNESEDGEELSKKIKIVESSDEENGVLEDVKAAVEESEGESDGKFESG